MNIAKRLSRIISRTLFLIATTLVLGCGGGGGSSTTPPGSGASVTLGGTVTGLIGTGLSLALNGSSTLSISGNGAYSFGVTLASATTYTVTIMAQPSVPSQVCTVSNGSGTTGTTNITSIDVSCAAPAASTTAPPAPSLSFATTSVKTLNFSWGNLSQATSYQLQSNTSGAGWVNVGSSVAAGGTTTSQSIAVHLKRWDNTLYRLQACNSAGCTSSNTLNVLSQIAQAIGYFKASNTENSDGFGRSVAISSDGSTLAIGAIGEDSNATGVNGNQAGSTATDSGAVYVFVRNGGAWTQQAYIKASNTESADAFGSSVALSADGSTLAVGAVNEASSSTGVNGNQTDNAATFAGAVYVFTRTGTTWSQQAYVKASNTAIFQLFGGSVALSADGSVLAVGATEEASNATGVNGNQNNSLASGSGAVYVFTRTGGTWSQQAYVKASNTDASDSFGRSVALSADGATLAVGADGEDSASAGVNGVQADNSASSAGAVYVFSRSGAVWTQQAYIKASNTNTGNFFGYTVSLSADGSTLAVGALNEGSNSIGINGDQTNLANPGTGAVYVFSRSGTTWTQQAYIKSSNPGVSDIFGFSVALSSDGLTLAVGAYMEDSDALGVNGDQNSNLTSDSGAVYVFSRSGTTWAQQSYVKASNTGTNDRFGFALSLSGDGASLAVGAYQESSNASGVGGNQADNSAVGAGAVYVY